MNKMLRSYLFFAVFFLSLCLSVSTPRAAVQDKLNQILETAENGVITGKEGWLYLQEELEYLAAGPFWGESGALVSKTSKKQFADPLPAIVDFHQQLAEKGITLLFLPIPPKALVYHDMLPEQFSADELEKLAETSQQFYALLAENGVRVVDLLPLLRQKREEAQLYCKTDSHYSGVGIRLIAGELARNIREMNISPSPVETKFVVTERQVAISGDLSAMSGKEDQQESLNLYFVESDDATTPVLNTNSDILLMGDSHTLVFSTGGDMHARGAGLGENLAAAVKRPVDVLGVRGSGATPVRIKLYQKNRREPQYLDNKKLVIWCLTAREFIGSGGWRKVPVEKVQK